MKKNCATNTFLKWKVFQFLIMMKVVWVIILATAFQSAASVSYSQETKISLNLKDVSLEEVIWSIKKLTQFNFFYQNEEIEEIKGLNVDVNDQTVDEILDQCLKSTTLTYDIVHKAVIIHNENNRNAVNSTGGELVGLQKQRITGRVTDSNGVPLPGVTVVVKGTAIGVVTDAEGNYSLLVPDDIKVLLFSFVGMKNKEVPYSGQTVLNVTLEEERTGIDEVVVVGYGVQKKVAVTGAVSTVGTKELVRSSSATLGTALAGRLSGISAIQSSGQPGRDDATIYLRGASTTNGKTPLILIDGVPRDNIRTIDPNEVETISVLKDASATAMFGVRGANGVIMITTRRGAEGKSELSISATQSFTSFTREPERIHSVDYMKLRNEALVNDGYDPQYTDDIIAKYENPLQGLDKSDPDYENKAKIRRYIYCDNDYYRLFIKRYSPQTRVNASITGGTKKISYFVNTNYLHQGGNLNTESKSAFGYDPSSKMDRYSFRANLDYKVADSFRAFLNLGSYIELVNMPSAGGNIYGGNTTLMISDIMYQAQTELPITPGPTTISGFGVDAGQIVDPSYLDRSAFEIMNRRGYRTEMRSNLNTTFGVDWDLSKLVTKGLSLRGMISYDAKSTTAEQGTKEEKLYTATVNYDTDELTYTMSRSSETLLLINKDVSSNYTINMQGIINYHRQFGKHDVGGMVVAQRDYWESTGGEIPYNVIGVAGRAMYNFDTRYFGEFNIGYNGSEQFAPGHRFGLFPAVSLGWVLSNEEFMKQDGAIDNLKLRMSYGEVGNDNIGSNRFLYLDNITIGSGMFSSLGNGTSISEGLLGNPDITWEVSKKQNYGIDFALFKCLSGSLDVFVEHRSKILLTRGSVPSLQGVAISYLPKANMGKVDNHGGEFELGYNKRLKNDLNLLVKGNISYNKNKVKFFDEAAYSVDYAYRYRTTGYSLGQQWGYIIERSNGNGYFNSQEELDNFLANTTYGFGSPRVGDFIYKDLNGDHVIDDKDKAPIGNTTIPGIIYGLTISTTYKAFDFSIFFQGVSKYSRTYADQGVYENTKLGTYFDYHKRAWTEERYANGEKITYPALSTQTTTNHTANSFFIMNRAFTRLKNIEVGYTLPSAKSRLFGVKTLRVYASAQNWFTWDHLKMGHLDPENSSSIGYPVTKMLNMGLNISF